MVCADSCHGEGRKGDGDRERDKPTLREKNEKIQISGDCVCVAKAVSVLEFNLMVTVRILIKWLCFIKQMSANMKGYRTVKFKYQQKCSLQKINCKHAESFNFYKNIL